MRSAEVIPEQLPINEAVVLIHQPAYPIDLAELSISTCHSNDSLSFYGCDLKSNAQMLPAIHAYRERIYHELKQRLQLRGFSSISSIRSSSSHAQQLLSNASSASAYRKLPTSTAIKAPYFLKAKSTEALTQLIKSLFTIA